MSADIATFRKPLQADCLLNGQLHPSIVERLRRLRELPVSTMASFLGAVQDEQGLWLEWEWVPGDSLDAFLRRPIDPTFCESIARQLDAAVRGMHAHGLVHGRLHTKNLILNPQGRLMLTHASPLLFSDRAVDWRAVDDLRKILCQPRSRPSAATPRPRLARLPLLLAGLALLAGVAISATAIFFSYRQ